MDTTRHYSTPAARRGIRASAIMAAFAAALAIAPGARAGSTIAYWDFSSDDKGEIDVTGNCDLVNSGGVTIADGAAVFDGTARTFCTENPISLSASKAYTIECFVQADADCSGMVMELSPNYTQSQNVGGFYILVGASGEAYVHGDSGYNGELFNSGTNIRGDGQWHRIALVVDPSQATPGETVRLYLDGVRQSNHVGNGTGSHLASHTLYIGSRGGTQHSFKGKIDDIRITEGVLDPSEFMSQSDRTAGTHVRAYWKFDSDTPLADASGNGNALQGSQGVTFADGLASFDGTASDVRTVGSLDLTDMTNVTVECFVRLHQGAGNNTAMVLEHSANYFANAQCFHINIGERGSASALGTFRFSDGYRAAYSPTLSLNAGWHHLALVKDSSSGTVSLFLDGVKQSSTLGSSSATGEALKNEVLYIGSRANNDLWLDADIDDIRITAQALRPRQFLQTRTGAMEDVIAYWPFRNAGTLLEDASGNGNTLTGSGVTVSREAAAVFDGTQSGFSTVAPLPLYAYDSLTVEWFMKANASGATMAVMEMSANYNSNVGAFAVFANESSGRVAGGFRMAENFNTLICNSALDGGWHHYALVYDSTRTDADIVRFYRDRQQVTTHGASYTGAVNLLSDVLYIGTRGGSSLPFVGELDDIKITGCALAPAEFMTKRSLPPGFIITFK